MRAQCVRTCMCLRACVRVCGRMCACMCVCDCMGVRVRICAYVCALAGWRMCMRACAYICMYDYYIIYYIDLQRPFVCLSVCLYPPPFSSRPSDCNQIWHTCSGIYGTHSQLKKNATHPTPGGSHGSF